MSDERKECCKQESNLGPVVQERKDLIYRRCAVCGCRHFELTLDPGVLFSKGKIAS
jgi:hypothetical protein